MSHDIELDLARQELGDEEYEKHLRYVFGWKCLDFVETIVINLPQTCYCDCDYCLDRELRMKRPLGNESYLKVVREVFMEFPNISRITITGGTADAKLFNEIMNSIEDFYDNVEVTWNTNGVAVSGFYNVENVSHINLHRQSIDEDENLERFHSTRKIISINSALRLWGDKLSIRTVIDENFDLDEYAELGIPLFLNRELPVSRESYVRTNNVIEKLNIAKTDRRRNNQYIDGTYKGIPVRIGLGDNSYEHIVGRFPVYLNVCIVHRTGVVSGTWFEDDKVLIDEYEVRV